MTSDSHPRSTGPSPDSAPGPGTVGDPGEPGVPQGADTLVDVLRAAADEGYEAQFVAKSDGGVDCTSCHRTVNPVSFTVDRVRRLEGASDPDDMALTAWAVCPSCGAKGVLTLGYGPNASDADEAVLPYLDLSRADASPSATETGAG